MGREQKKGRAGNARAYITRAKALEKLQLSLPEFRRLCILKGIYPRDPNKKYDGADKTYYLAKDIDFLAHEPVIDTIRAEKAHHKKVKKATAKKQLDVLKSLALRAPKTSLDHIIVERFPQFTDALRELDDPLCSVALFASLPAEQKHGIQASRVANCKRLIREFHHFIAFTHALRRVFVSIKGFYYQAELQGELITWVTPHRFSQNLPDDVDYSVMLTFLELYECLLNFVNFRLYTGHNLAYPPKIDSRADAESRELSSIVTQPISIASEARKRSSGTDNTLARTAISEEKIKAAQKLIAESAPLDEALSDEDDDEDPSGDANQNPDAAPSEPKLVTQESNSDDSPDIENIVERDTEADKLLFAGKTFVLGRETPVPELEFVLKSSGAHDVYYDADFKNLDESEKAQVTYWVMDRPAVSAPRIMSVDYVQPQFVFDSVNAGVVLPAQLYGPGTALPPHLSPFVQDEDDGGYRPWFKDVIERIKAGDKSVLADSAVVEYMRASKQDNDETGRKKYNANSSAPHAHGTEERSSVVSVEPLSADGDADINSLDADMNNDSADSRAEDGSEESEDDDICQDNHAEDDEAKQLRLLMMSRGKRKKYNKFTRAEKAKSDRKAKLTARRNQSFQTTSAKESSRPAKKARV